MGRRRRRRKQLLDALKKTRRYWKIGRSHSVENWFWKGCGLVVMTTTTTMMIMMMKMMMIILRQVIEVKGVFFSCTYYVTRTCVVLTAVIRSITTVSYNVTSFSLVQRYQKFRVTCNVFSTETIVFLEKLLPIILTALRHSPQKIEILTCFKIVHFRTPPYIQPRNTAV